MALMATLFHHTALGGGIISNEMLILFAGAAVGDEDLMEKLIHRVPVDVTTNDGRTPLFYAVEYGHAGVVTTLIEHGALVNVHLKSRLSGCERETPFTLAGRAGHMKIFRALIVAGTPVNVRDSDGKTPLVSAARWSFFPGMQLLIACGGALRYSDVPQDEYPWTLGTLDTMGNLRATSTFEFEPIYKNLKQRTSRWQGNTDRLWIELFTQRGEENRGSQLEVSRVLDEWTPDVCVRRVLACNVHHRDCNYQLSRGKSPHLPPAIDLKQRKLIHLMAKPKPAERVKMAFVVDTLHEIAEDERAKAVV